jgi:3-deoxy-D-manno-octulosonic-acid transferase
MSIRRLLYSLVLYLIFPIVILRLLWRSRNNPAYRQRISERLGLFATGFSKPVIWVHAVSVGETVAAKPLVEALLNKYPDCQLLLTSTTPTGSATVKRLFADRVFHVYFPYDLPEIIFRFLNRVQPRLLIIVETEIWPNLYAACKKRQIPIMLANARLSEKSMQGYKKISGLMSETLKNLDVIAVRSEQDARRFKQLGAGDKQIVVAGNIKFDLVLDAKQLEQGRKRKEQWGAKRPVWVAASTHAGEEILLLKIHAHLLKKNPDCLLVLIPRHQERFDEVFSLSQQQKAIHVVRHSQQQSYEALHASVILGDSMGDMQSWYAAADAVFMGGSLVETGGHNPLEAVALSRPVVTGPHVFNFEDIYPLLTEAGLGQVCNDTSEIKTTLRRLLSSTSRDNISNQKAKEFIKEFGGVTNCLMKQVKRLLIQA